MKGHKLEPLLLQCHSQHKKSHSVTAAECMNGIPMERLEISNLFQLNQQLWSHIYMQRTINTLLNYITTYFRMRLLECRETYCSHLHYVLKTEAADTFETFVPIYLNTQPCNPEHHYNFFFTLIISSLTKNQSLLNVIFVGN